MSATSGGELGVSIASIAAVAGDEAEGVAGSGSLGTIKTKAASVDSAATIRGAPILSQRAPRRRTLCRFCWSGGAPCHNQSPETPSSGTLIKAGGSVMISPWPRCLEQGDPLRQDDRLKHENAQPVQSILEKIIASEPWLAAPANFCRPGAAADPGPSGRWVRTSCLSICTSIISQWASRRRFRAEIHVAERSHCSRRSRKDRCRTLTRR